jgi:cob(I)alamin adenosyltransferase
MGTEGKPSKLTPRGLVVINTGDGKGKTTAALGVVFRALGRGMSCGVVQFIKGKWETGEKIFAETIPQLKFHVMGLGFTWDSDDLDKDKKAARMAWEQATEMILGGQHRIIVLDEITYTFHHGWLTPAEVIDVLKKRPVDVHVILTGRRCPSELTDYADLVSVIQNEKHPFIKGMPAQIGMDF